jgi:prevent-host-death family protein
MAKVPEIVPVTDLRQRAADVLRKVRESRDPLVITQRGRAAAVLLSMDSYEQAERERELLLMLVRGDKEIAVGVGVGLDEVMEEADRLLDEGLQ